jgi:hypothetical protein
MNIDDVNRDRFAALFKVLSPPVMEPPTDLLQALQGLPEPFLLPSPWATWLFMTLCCYRNRQTWLETVVERYLPEVFPSSEDLREQLQPVTCDFRYTNFWPGVVELECECGFGRTPEAPVGEAVTFGLTDKTKGIFFVEELQNSLSGIYPANVRERFQELHSSEHSVWYAVSDLEAAGLLDKIYFDERHADFGGAPEGYRLSDAAVWHQPLIDRFCQRWGDESQRLWLSATIGDWLKADEEAQRIGNTDLINVTGPRAEFQRQERRLIAQRSVATGAPCEADRHVLADLQNSVT